jgi:ATP-binding cassette subfamily B protein
MFGEVQRRLDNLNTVMQENLAGVRLVKAFVRDEHEIKRFRDVNDDLMSQTILAMRTAAVGWPFVMLTLNLGVVGALWFGGQQVIGETLQVGALVAFINYLMRTLMSMLFVTMLTMRMARAQASAERVIEVLESDPQVKNRMQTTRSFRPDGAVAFDNVTFSYNGEDQDPVLKGLSFTAEPGQMVAILGATGSGKSSLIHLIPRFYDVSEGHITIDGVDIRDLDKETLRRNIGIALQESVLFTGTIRDNIRYGRPDATDEEVIAAAKAAQAHDFIRELPDGYDTELGQRGVNLSGGQKQRVAIARALLVEPAILILDDSTSSVDVETETKIQEALESLMKDRTSFVVAQRISTVLNADKILVLDEGAIVGEGTHRELLAYSPIYREIYESQLGNGANSHG